MNPLQIMLNGAARTLTTDDVVTVTHVVPLATADGAGVAVAVNGVVVPHSAWPSTALTDGDHVEVVTAVQGG